ncbi:MAG: L-seryl-tRNA(Sec) selenium transferase [Dehalococcoidales bacterium]
MSGVSGNRGKKGQASEQLRRLPSVERVLEASEIQAEIGSYSRPLVTQATQAVVAEVRARIRRGATCPPEAEILSQIKDHLSREWPAFLSPVINGTGVILHTNLGRAPLSRQALDALVDISGGYCNLEYDLLTGKRGTRAQEVEKLLCVLTGAEGALLVNNNAAAVLLILAALAVGKEVIVSRGELVQIGGGFRLPEIMEQSGSRLKEVGTTNKTFAYDYENAIGDRTALLLKVHQSNFAIRGFTHAVGIAELVALGQKYHLPLVYDLGSGALLATEDFGLEHEPMVPEAIAGGADLVCFSGDKLLGGPQAGIIVGKKSYLDRLRRHPLQRILRIDKMFAVALGATLKHYLKKEAVAKIPVWQMIALGVQELELRAESVASRLGQAGITAEILDGVSTVGGGSLPDQTLATKLVAIRPSYPVEDFARRLRLARPPLLGRIEGEHFLIDMRTVMPSLDDSLIEVIKGAPAEVE